MTPETGPDRRDPSVYPTNVPGSEFPEFKPDSLKHPLSPLYIPTRRPVWFPLPIPGPVRCGGVSVVGLWCLRRTRSVNPDCDVSR